MLNSPTEQNNSFFRTQPPLLIAQINNVEMSFLSPDWIFLALETFYNIAQTFWLNISS